MTLLAVVVVNELRCSQGIVEDDAETSSVCCLKTLFAPHSLCSRTSEQTCAVLTEPESAESLLLCVTTLLSVLSG
jgi:hypothetical protein